MLQMLALKGQEECGHKIISITCLTVNSTLSVGLAMRETSLFKIHICIDNNFSQLSQHFTPQKRLSRISRRTLGSTRLTRTIWSYFWLWNIKNKYQFPDPYIITTTGFLGLIVNTIWLLIAAIIFGTCAFGFQSCSVWLVW